MKSLTATTAARTIARRVSIAHLLPAGALLAFTVTLLLVGQAFASGADAPTKIADLLRVDGTIDLGSGFSGSVDMTGFELAAAADGAPRSAAGGVLMGSDEHWDIVAIGIYPDAAAVLALFADDAYREAYVHRMAAVEQQRVVIARG